nr:uncharacterized protein LOC106687179 [Halyomorpha halys]
MTHFGVNKLDLMRRIDSVRDICYIYYRQEKCPAEDINKASIQPSEMASYRTMLVLVVALFAIAFASEETPSKTGLYYGGYGAYPYTSYGLGYPGYYGYSGLGHGYGLGSPLLDLLFSF